MRILLICEAFRTLGGIQEVVDNLAVELEKAGQQVIVFSTPFTAGQERPIRFGGECRYLEIPTRRPVTLRHLERLWQPSLSSEVKQVSSEIIGVQPNVVSSHCWSWDRFPAVVAACHCAGVPLVHSLFDSWGGGKMGTAALRSLQGTAALTALSEATRRFFEPLLPAAHDARVITGGVDPAAVETSGPCPHPRPYVFCAARLDLRHKAIDALIEAFAMLANDRPGIDLLISGSGPDREALQALAVSIGIGDRVRFLGVVERSALWTLYKNALFFAMPSRMPEGLGLVFLEAMAAGVPVIGTRSGGTPEIVDHGRTGLLVNDNAPAELATAMRQLLNDDGERRRMGERARQRVVSRYTWRQFAAQYLEVYSACGGANGSEFEPVPER